MTVRMDLIKWRICCLVGDTYGFSPNPSIVPVFLSPHPTVNQWSINIGEKIYTFIVDYTTNTQKNKKTIKVHFTRNLSSFKTQTALRQSKVASNRFQSVIAISQVIHPRFYNNWLKPSLIDYYMTHYSVLWSARYKPM